MADAVAAVLQTMWTERQYQGVNELGSDAALFGWLTSTDPAVYYGEPPPAAQTSQWYEAAKTRMSRVETLH